MRGEIHIPMMQIFMSNRINFDKNSAGFSLLELLISISLLGLMMTLLYAGFFQISNSSMKLKSSLEKRQELRLLMKMVLDDLQNIQYLTNFANAGQSLMPRNETGLIVEIAQGPINPETGDYNEVSLIFFHTTIKSRFFPEITDPDPLLHEVSYVIQENLETKTWEFIRREDYYLDNNIREGGKSYILSETVTEFNLELLESETALAGGGYREKWTKVWNSDEALEDGCSDPKIKGNFCLPRAIKLTMAISGEDGNSIKDTQVSNLCIPPCNQEIFQ